MLLKMNALDLEKRDEAYISDLERRIANNPHDIEALIHTAVMLYILNKDVNRALKLFQDVLGQDPSNTDVYMWKGEFARFFKGDFFEAIKSFKKALDIDANRADCHALLAYVLYDMNGASHEIDFHYKKACKLEPSFVNSYFYYAQYLFKEGRFTEARERLEEARRALQTCYVESKNPVQEYYESMITGRDYPEIKQHLLDLLEKINQAEKTANGNA